MKEHYILTLSCQDQVGIVAAVSQFITRHGGNIFTASQHGEPSINHFFMRVAIDKSSIKLSIDEIKQAFQPIADQFNMTFHLRDASQLKRVIILVSKQSHCLSDLLYRWSSGDLPCDIVAVISNHHDMQDFVTWHNIPYYPISLENKAKGYAAIDAIIQEHRADVIVLARFMQIIPPEMCRRYFGNMINIHHSFLPAFVGANPYAKAFEKGVKLIGATCHYVTETLDEGPIIEQDVVRIDHSFTEQDIKRHGKDVEKTVLARGLRYHLEDKVIIHGNKTVVL